MHLVVRGTPHIGTEIAGIVVTTKVNSALFAEK
jgi:hypothetical protein